MWSNPQKSADVVTFAEEILNVNFIFCAVKDLFEYIIGFNIWRRDNWNSAAEKANCQITAVLVNCFSFSAPLS